jgi:D-alanine-D-alanine ligase
MAGARVAVLFGGPSAEHEISIRSADSLASWLVESGLGVLLVHLRRDGAWSFAPLEPSADESVRSGAASRLAGAARGIALGDALARLAQEAGVVFPIVHGTLGEDGSLQGFLRVLGLPCAGPGLLASALSMDKARAKAVVAAATGLPLPRGLVISRGEFARRGASPPPFPGPWIVKPLDAGSSVGLALVEDAARLHDAVASALAVEGVTAALLEEFVDGVEVTCAVVGDPESGLEALPPILIKPAGGGLFDWKAKYTPGGSEEICPAPLPEPTLARIRAAALAAYRALDCRGFGRVDFVLREGEPWFLELNTLPGLTRESLFPKAARAAGHELPKLFRSIVERAAAAAAPRRALQVGAAS